MEHMELASKTFVAAVCARCGASKGRLHAILDGPLKGWYCGAHCPACNDLEEMQPVGPIIGEQLTLDPRGEK